MSSIPSSAVNYTTLTNGGQVDSSVDDSQAANDYNQLMTDISANGTSGDQIEQDIANYEQDVPAGLNPDVDNAMANIASSLSDGTYSQQGSEAALEGAATADGLQNVISPEMLGQNGVADQDAGKFDPASTYNTQAGGNSAVSANANILVDQLEWGAPQSQELNNANALLKEAQGAGDASTADAVQNMINSFSDGTFSAQGSANAISSALSRDQNSGNQGPIIRQL